MANKDLQAKIIDRLFKTGAIRVSPAEQPFWYTSGLIGPYYVNTHFLFGSEPKANDLLQLMDSTREQPLACTRAVRAALLRQYKENMIFKEVTDAIVEIVRSKFDLDAIDYFAGGERRDWFFSILPAELLGKPHLTIFKDQQVVLLDGENVSPCTQVDGAQVLHISDLVTEASSYLRAWIPALEKLQAKMVATITVVDRAQGGAAALAAAEVPFTALVRMDDHLFARAAAQGYISAAQQKLVTGYLADPHQSMREFLINEPAFLQNALKNSDPRTVERAKRLLAENLYDLPIISDNEPMGS